MNNKIITSAAILLLSIGSLQAQQAANSAGGNASGQGGTSNFSVGQTVYTTASGTGGSTSQGVQQAYDIEVLTGDELSDISLNMNAYPNPTTSNLTLTVADISDLSYKLYDLQGNEVESNGIADQATQINLEEQSTAVYFLKVLQNNTPLKTFKIIKY